MLTFKILMLGNSGVGKTRLVHEYFGAEEGQALLLPGEEGVGVGTVGVDFKRKSVGNLKLHVWDTGGKIEYRAIARSYYNNADAVIFVYSISDRLSFYALINWVRDYLQKAGSENKPLMLIGNKDDKPRCVSAQEGQAFADVHNMCFVETSARTGRGVAAAFELLLASSAVSVDQTQQLVQHEDVEALPSSWCCCQ
jgi:small GTP-binding protein